MALPPLSAGGEVVADYRANGLSLRAHPLSFLRGTLTSLGARPCTRLAEARDGTRLTVCGLVLMRQRPGSAKGTLFLTLEDETGIANLIVRPDLFERSPRTVLAARLMACRGRVQRVGEVVHLIAVELFDRSDLLMQIGEEGTIPEPEPGRDTALPVRSRNFR